MLIHSTGTLSWYLLLGSNAFYIRIHCPEDGAKFRQKCGSLVPKPDLCSEKKPNNWEVGSNNWEVGTNKCSKDQWFDLWISLPRPPGFFFKTKALRKWKFLGRFTSCRVPGWKDPCVSVRRESVKFRAITAVWMLGMPRFKKTESPFGDVNRKTVGERNWRRNLDLLHIKNKKIYIHIYIYTQRERNVPMQRDKHTHMFTHTITHICICIYIYIYTNLLYTFTFADVHLEISLTQDHQTFIYIYIFADAHSPGKKDAH